MPEDRHLPWTDEQWATMQRIVHESARKARVASSFLPLIGPLPPGQASVPALQLNQLSFADRLRGEAPRRLEIDDGDSRLSFFEVPVAGEVAHHLRDVLAGLLVRDPLDERVELHPGRARHPAVDRVGSPGQRLQSIPEP